MFRVLRGTRKSRSFLNSFASYQTYGKTKIVTNTNSDSLCCFHRVPPPKESMKVFVENRRLLMSIAVLQTFTMVLALQLVKSQL